MTQIQNEGKRFLSQSQKILNHLKSGRGITQLEALRLYGCLRLGARIYDLKEKGYAIDSKMVSENGKRYAKYFLLPKWNGRQGCNETV